MSSSYRPTEYEINYLLGKISAMGAINAVFQHGHLSKAAITYLLDKGYIRSFDQGYNEYGSNEAFMLTDEGIAWVYERGFADENAREIDALVRKNRAQAEEARLLMEEIAAAGGAPSVEQVAEAIKTINGQTTVAEATINELAVSPIERIEKFIGFWKLRAGGVQTSEVIEVLKGVQTGLVGWDDHLVAFRQFKAIRA